MSGTSEPFGASVIYSEVLPFTTDEEALDVCKAVAQHYYHQPGVVAYALFEHFNTAYFAGELPTPLILWALTPWGGCLGQTWSAATPPVILLHPSLLTPSTENPWGVPIDWLGIRYAADTLLHECIHVSVHYRLGGPTGGTSSHNNPQWIGEVNRLLPLLGFPPLTAAMSKPKRINKKVVRHSAGTMPFDAAAKFPYALRRWLGQAEAFYTDRHLPWPLTVPESTAAWLTRRGYTSLDVTHKE